MTTLELFTRKRPFDHLQHPCAIISHILRKERERPSPDVSCSRMTDEWWSICLLCWVRDPSQRAPMLNVVRNIRTIQTESKVVTQSLPCKVSSVRVNHLDDNASPGAWDPRNILNELVQRASRYCINLDGLVSKDHTGSRRLEGYAIISSGTLQLNEELMTRWTASSGFLKYGNTIKVAIKTSRGTLLEVVDVEAIMKFLKELHSWSKLNHENVLPLIGIATQFDYTLSIVSPWMKKGDARNFVRDKSVDPRPLIEGIASGLCYLHNCIPTPLYHEDVKGANVLISEDGRALLTDFGLSFLTDSTFSMSTPGRVEGSLPWIPPEMLDGGEASTAGDVWAFAMTALELFTRQDPFHPCRSIFAILTRITQGPPDRPRLEDTHGRLTKEWWSMCSECWHPDPFSRPTMLQVTTKIEQIMACNRTRDDGITMTSSLALEEFSMLASSYGLDLGAQIKRDESLSNPDLTTFTFRGKLRHSGERGTMALQSSLRSPKETMVVVKEIRDGPPLYRVLAKHMVDGVYALTTLRHENILPLLGLTTNFDGKVSLMSEWIERGDAHEYVQNGDVDPGPLLLGVANGLQYLHNHAPHPILHGALKGSNILISSDRQPLLTDFGLFDLIDPPLVNRLGTINWTSPECLLNPKGSAAGDVWAFAMTTLELFTRVLPFDSIRRPEELRRHIFRGPPDRLSNETTYERLTDGWWEICLLCWSKDPSLRPSIDKVLGMIKIELFDTMLQRDKNRLWRMLTQST